MSVPKEIMAIQNSPEDVYVIHCAHVEANNRNQFNPRILCIYIKNLNASFSEKISIEKYASKHKIGIDVIADWYDDLEIYVLDGFNSFLKAKSKSTFIYWAEEGQELILDILKSRFDEVNKDDSKKFETIPSVNRNSVQFLVKKMVPHAEVHNDLKLFVKQHNNEQVINNFLTDGESSVCFDNKEFNKIGSSVISKVDFFVKIINDYSNGSTSKSISNKGAVPSIIDIRSLKPMVLIKGLSFGSWSILMGFIIAAYTFGWGLEKYLTDSDLKDLQKEKSKIEQESKNKALDFEKQYQLKTDSIKEFRLENSLLNKNVKSLKDSITLLNKKK